ncbi:ATP binding protein [Tritrichomonas foetus]|uniref:GPN-loop GTPase 2 n=1 Tax=Tritrichomonas foetus TaxID=1144522 RepID=A0A1J4JX53_9EUKA|nr:ATP binding protein [Tritrichomonas foetus]|eukprot:OHT03729.1 ATP binding protein [Tritrichomonas foetus]
MNPNQKDPTDRCYGAMFIGPPGSGKSSCVVALKEMCEKLKRNVITINLDPANIHIPFTPNFDICTVMNVTSTMKEQQLGPNGALMYCMESLAESAPIITKALKPLVKKGTYFLIDCPGQVELYTHSDSMRRFIRTFEQDLDATLATVNMVDVTLAATADGFLGQSLMSLGMMLRMYTPHINVLSKFDLTSEMDLPYDPFDVDFDDFTETDVPNKLHTAIVDVLNGFDLVSYTPFTINDETCIMELLGLIDKAVGCTWML